ncbi:MAG: thioredoxin family protein [Candidatus Binatia bacterium]
MARTPSTMKPLGTVAHPFRLPDVTTGRQVGLEDFRSAKGLLVMFICNHCPYVQHVRSGLAAFAREYRERGLAIVGINSNDVETHPEDSPARMVEEAKAHGYVFPYLFDEAQDVAKAYEAACTPDFFLYDHERKVVYRGQFDGSRPGNGVPVTGEDLRAACEAVLAGQPIPAEQCPSLGCNIKWKPGNAPNASNLTGRQRRTLMFFSIGFSDP